MTFMVFLIEYTVGNEYWHVHYIWAKSITKYSNEKMYRLIPKIKNCHIFFFGPKCTKGLIFGGEKNKSHIIFYWNIGIEKILNYILIFFQIHFLLEWLVLWLCSKDVLFSEKYGRCRISRIEWKWNN